MPSASSSIQRLLISRSQAQVWSDHPEAVHLPYFEALKTFSKLPRDRKIVLVCEVGLRSAGLAEAMRRSGFDAVNFKGGIQIGAPLIALWFALSIYTGAFIAENVRAGIQAVSKGQTEAASALGLRPNRVMNLVVLPQALRVIIPPLNSNYMNITKNSSLAIAIGYMDVVATIGGISLNQTGREMECMIIVLGIYLCLSLIISSIMNWYNNRIKLVER